MERPDREGDNQGFITQEGDNTFQRIRTGYFRQVTKTSKMVSCSRRVAELRTAMQGVLHK